jgi:hypothetical protein
MYTNFINTTALCVAATSFTAAIFYDPWTLNNRALTTIRNIALRDAMLSGLGQYTHELITSFIEKSQTSSDYTKTIQGARISVLTGCFLLVGGISETITLLSSNTNPNLNDPAQLAYGTATITSIFHKIYLGASLISNGSHTAAEA